MSMSPPDHPAGAAGPSTPDAQPAPGDALSAVLVGSGELRRNTGIGPSYTGHILFPERTILLEAEVTQDPRGRFFAITAKINLDDCTHTELDRLLTAPSSCGAGLGGPRRLPPVGPIEDDPIPFEPA